MLDKFRNKKNSVVIIGAFAIIILVFVFWGVGPSGNRGGDQRVVATVDGKPIQVKAYAALFKRELDYYRNKMKGQSTDDIIRSLDLKHRTVDTLINRAIAVQAAKDEGLGVSVSEVQDTIKNIPVFSQDGVFNKDQYLRILKSNRITPGEFEKGVEEDLLSGKMREKIVSGVAVSEQEAKDAYYRINRKVDLDYVTVDPAAYKSGVEVTKEEGMKFLRDNGSMFMLPARIKAYYAYADFAAFSKGIKISDEEAKSYYDKNNNEFMTSEMVKARHILIRPDVTDKDTAAAREAARKKAEGILAKVQAGGDFAKLAKENSDDPGSYKQGGDLGWFQRGVMIKPFEQAVFSMKKGEVSGLVETEFGFHIIKLEDRKDAELKPFKDVEAGIKKKLALDKGEVVAREAALAVKNSFMAAKSVDDLKKAVSEKPPVKGVLTPLFTDKDSGVAINGNEMVRDIVFTLRQDDVSRILETPEGIYVVKIVEKINPHVPEYDAVASKIKDILTEQKASEKAESTARQYIERLKNGEGFASLARKESLLVHRTGYFSLVNGFIPKIGAFAGDKPEIFTLTAEAPYYKDVLKHDGKFYILRFAADKAAPESGFAQMKDEITKRLLAQKQDKAIEDWFTEKRKHVKVQVFENRL